MHNMYLKLDGIKGDSVSDQGKDQIEILSMNHGVMMPLTEGSHSNVSAKHGRCIHQEMTIVKHLDSTSPTLNLKCSGGDNIKSASISIFQAEKADGKPIEYYKIELEDCIITAISIGASGSDLPVETVTIHYNKIKWTYKKQSRDAPGGDKGNVATGWDLETNKKV